MLECQPIPTMRAFLASELTYVLPAPGGALADGGVLCGENGDLYLAALASKAKARIGDSRSTVEYLQTHLMIVRDVGIFDLDTDERIIARLGGWIRELTD